MARLPQNLAGSLGGLAQTQLVWLLIGLAIVAVLGVAVRNDVWLRGYKYTWAAIGVAMLVGSLDMNRWCRNDPDRPGQGDRRRPLRLTAG